MTKIAAFSRSRHTAAWSGRTEARSTCRCRTTGLPNSSPRPFWVTEPAGGQCWIDDHLQPNSTEANIMPSHEFCSVSYLQSGCNIFLREPHEVLSCRQGHCPSGCGGFHICLDLVLWCIMFFHLYGICVGCQFLGWKKLYRSLGKLI